MDFITEEVQKSLNLTPEQIEGIKPLYNDHVAKIKNDFEGTANKNAENIIEGAITSTQKKYGVELPRTEGEKNADYLARLNEKVDESQQSNITKLENELKQKVKDFDGGNATKEELKKAQEALDKALEKYADYDDLKALADKYTPLETEYKNLKDKVFFQNEKPTFPDTVNPYEAEAKWNKFVNSFNEKWEKSFDESGKSIAIAKDNPHLKKELKELISSDEDLKTLLTGRQQAGTGGKTGHKVGDLDISLPENPTSEDKSKAINEHLDKLGFPKMSKERTKKFTEVLKQVDEALKK